MKYTGIQLMTSRVSLLPCSPHLCLLHGGSLCVVEDELDEEGIDEDEEDDELAAEDAEEVCS